MSVPSTNQRSFFKDVQELYRSIDSSTDGQASIESVDDLSVRISLRPKAGYNAHATFYMSVKTTTGYPSRPPTVSFDTPIFHPNIDFLSGDVCLSIFSQWRSCYSLLDLVKAILYLIYHPNFDSNLSSFSEAKTPEQLATRSAFILAGLSVDGFQFAPNEDWCSWARENNCLPKAEDVTDDYVWIPPGVEDKQIENIVEMQEPRSTMSCGSMNNYDEEALEACSNVSSETVPSFAKYRHSLDDYVEDDRSMSHIFQPYNPVELGMHRIGLSQPSKERTDSSSETTYYYAEVICVREHRDEIGSNYIELFKGSLTFDMQVDPEWRQRSRLYAWYPYYIYDSTRVSEGSSRCDRYYLDLLFKDPPPPKDLAADFCPWSKDDGRGQFYLLNGLFFEGQRDCEGFTCFLDKSTDDDDDADDNAIIDLFNYDSQEEDKNHERIGSDYDVTNVDSPSYDSDEALEELLPEYLLLLKEIDEGACNDVSLSSSFDLDFQLSLRRCASKMRLCYNCNGNMNYLPGYINENLHPNWKWVFHQTRWPIRFAPQQTIDLNISGILIPPWRGSSSRLLHDVRLYCTKYPNIDKLILLDCMSLSPLSPLLNLMQSSPNQGSQLTGVLWMTPFQAISPFFRVPIPPNSGWTMSLLLRYLAVDAYIGNWVSWLSRTEVYSSLGASRPLSLFMTDSVAARILQPHSLGCGALPIFDLLPLWMLRSVLKVSLQIPNWISSLSQTFTSTSRSIHAFIPFSDMDEI